MPHVQPDLQIRQTRPNVEPELQVRPTTDRHARPTDAVRELTHRVQAEYAEMPGLSVTVPQAQRLWDTDRHTCETVFTALVGRGVLRRTPKGRFIRART